MSESHLMDWALGLGSSDGDAQSEASERRARREARMRAAFLRARDTYRPKIESDAWFFAAGDVNAAPDTDTKTIQRLEACIVYLYYEEKYAEAYTWACALLRRLHVIGIAVWPDNGAPHWIEPPAGSKEACIAATSSVARETLDTALRCLVHMDRALVLEPRAECPDAAVITAAYERVHTDEPRYTQLWTHGCVDEAAVRAAQVRAASHKHSHSGHCCRVSLRRWAMCAPGTIDGPVRLPFDLTQALSMLMPSFWACAGRSGACLQQWHMRSRYQRMRKKI